MSIVLRRKYTQAFLDPVPTVSASQHNLLMQEEPEDTDPLVMGILPAKDFKGGGHKKKTTIKQKCTFGQYFGQIVLIIQ